MCVYVCNFYILIKKYWLEKLAKTFHLHMHTSVFFCMYFNLYNYIYPHLNEEFAEENLALGAECSSDKLNESN